MFYGYFDFILGVILITCVASFWGLFVSPFPIAWVSSVLIFPIIFCNVVVMFGGVVDPVWHKPKSGNINKTQ